jgi:hypothetical protein
MRPKIPTIFLHIISVLYKLPWKLATMFDLGGNLDFCRQPRVQEIDPLDHVTWMRRDVNYFIWITVHPSVEPQILLSERERSHVILCGMHFPVYFSSILLNNYVDD